MWYNRRTGGGRVGHSGAGCGETERVAGLLQIVTGHADAALADRVAGAEALQARLAAAGTGGVAR